MEWSHKATFSSETAAALAGGYTAVMDMPNTPPPTVDAPGLARKMRELGEGARCDYGVWLGADPAGAPTPETMTKLARGVCGLKLYCGHTTGTLEIDRELMGAYIKVWPGPGPLGLHAEDDMIGAFIDDLARWRKRGHICHIHSAYAVSRLRRAKEDGLPITAGVTPHHLYLTERDLDALGPKAVMKPPLGTAADREALWEGLRSGVVDMVETDHAPHTWQEKTAQPPAFGVPGLDTCLPLLVTAANEGRLPLERLQALVADAPRLLLGLPAADPDTFTLIDTKARWTVSADSLKTACGWSPFEGFELTGRVVKVVLRGRAAYVDARIVLEPGFGANLYTETAGSVADLGRGREETKASHKT